MNRYGAAISTDVDLNVAVKSCAEEALRQMDGQAPDLGFFFVSTEHHAGFEHLGEQLQQETGARHLVGTAAESIVGGDREVEAGPALSLWLGHFPEARLHPFRLTTEWNVTEEGERQVSIAGMPMTDLPSPEEIAHRGVSLFLLADPFSFPIVEWLDELNRVFPGLVACGGLASGGTAPGTNRLFHDDQVVRDGAVGVLLEGVPIQRVVSQGCRPIGRSMIITRSHDNVIEELAGKTPVQQLEEIYRQADEKERDLLQAALEGGALHIGHVVDERISRPRRGDFLVRNVMGSDSSTGAISIGDYARRGRTVCFHVRDRESADEDLRLLLDAVPGDRPASGLLFTCNGRGTRFFGSPHHDAAAIREKFTGLPLAGFFAQGEIGSVGGKNFLHGFTASLALFA